jgi:Protein of unknown function (DUF3014)
MARKNQDSFWPWGLGAGVVLIGVGVGLYILQRPPSEPAVAPAEVTPPITATPQRAPPSAPTAGEPRRAPSLPLPPLDRSDASVLGGLTELLGPEAVAKYVVPERLIRHVVVTVDNAAREQMAVNQQPVRPPQGAFVTSGPDSAPVLSPTNYDRYTPFVAVIERIDAKTLVALYRGLQPLFQQAYEELGHPNGVFNSRLIEVINLLAQTPQPADPIRLVQPSVLYRYANADLEGLASGQKLLIRMGPDNAAAVKAKLREILAELR